MVNIRHQGGLRVKSDHKNRLFMIRDIYNIFFSFRLQRLSTWYQYQYFPWHQPLVLELAPTFQREKTEKTLTKKKLKMISLSKYCKVTTLFVEISFELRTFFNFSDKPFKIHTHLAQFKHSPGTFIFPSGFCRVKVEKILKSSLDWSHHRVSVQGVKSLGGHFACLCRGLNIMK